MGLTLSRRLDEYIVLTDGVEEIRVYVHEIRRSIVKLKFEAPERWNIVRSEIAGRRHDVSGPE